MRAINAKVSIGLGKKTAARNNQCPSQNAMEVELFKDDVGVHIWESYVCDYHGVTTSPDPRSCSKAIRCRIHTIEALTL